MCGKNSGGVTDRMDEQQSIQEEAPQVAVEANGVEAVVGGRTGNGNYPITLGETTLYARRLSDIFSRETLQPAGVLSGFFLFSDDEVPTEYTVMFTAVAKLYPTGAVYGIKGARITSHAFGGRKVWVSTLRGTTAEIDAFVHELLSDPERRQKFLDSDEISADLGITSYVNAIKNGDTTI